METSLFTVIFAERSAWGLSCICLMFNLMNISTSYPSSRAFFFRWEMVETLMSVIRAVFLKAMPASIKLNVYNLKLLGCCFSWWDMIIIYNFKNINVRIVYNFKNIFCSLPFQKFQLPKTNFYPLYKLTWGVEMHPNARKMHGLI